MMKEESEVVATLVHTGFDDESSGTPAKIGLAHAGDVQLQDRRQGVPPSAAVRLLQIQGPRHRSF
jgi:hypothetical protein